MTEVGPEVRRAVVGDAAAVAALHESRIPEGFLATLGQRFLSRLYRRMTRSPAASLFVVDDADGVAGFVASASDTGRFYKEFLRKDGIAAGASAAGALLRAPKQVWETLRYGAGGEDHDLPPAEILAVAVATRAVGRGLGGVLVARALTDFHERAVTSAHVVTAVGNESALRMYERAGFRRYRRTEVHAGIAQDVLVWP